MAARSKSTHASKPRSLTLGLPGGTPVHSILPLDHHRVMSGSHWAASWPVQLTVPAHGVVDFGVLPRVPVIQVDIRQEPQAVAPACTR